MEVVAAVVAMMMTTVVVAVVVLLLMLMMLTMMSMLKLMMMLMLMLKLTPGVTFMVMEMCTIFKMVRVTTMVLMIFVMCRDDLRDVQGCAEDAADGDHRHHCLA